MNWLMFLLHLFIRTPITPVVTSPPPPAVVTVTPTPRPKATLTLVVPEKPVITETPTVYVTDFDNLGIAEGHPYDSPIAGECYAQGGVLVPGPTSWAVGSYCVNIDKEVS